jgi:hypothetical protein
MFGAGDADEGWIQSWPLQASNYKAFLLRSTDQPYVVVAESGTFSVRPGQATTLRVDEAVAAAESDIRDLLRQDQPLGPKFVRLGFHDCVGGCDGCVDLRNPDNGGLDLPIAALEMIVADHENLSIGFSRADIWALAALLGADMAQGTDRVDFSMQWVGRQNCQGSPELGPNRELPPADITTAGLFHFFDEQFGCERWRDFNAPLPPGGISILLLF